MGLNIPNVSEVVYPAQGYLDDCDLQISRAQAQGCGVIAATQSPMYSGACTATASGLTITVTSCTTAQTWVPVPFTGTTVTLPAASSTDRKDLVYIDGTGTLQYLMGTPCAVSNWTPSSGVVPPNKPDLPGNGVSGLPGQAVAVCEVYVPAGASSLTSDNIVNKAAGLYPLFSLIGTLAGVGGTQTASFYGSSQVTNSGFGATPSCMLLESSTLANLATVTSSAVETTGTYASSTTFTVGSTTGLSVGMGVVDLTNLSYINAGCYISHIAGSTITVANNFHTPTVNNAMSGDTLQFVAADTYDFNTALHLRNNTANGSGLVIGNAAQGDGLYAKANNALWLGADPNVGGRHPTTGNALNIYGGTSTVTTGLSASGSAANGSDSVALNLSRFSSAWAIKIYGEPDAWPNVRDNSLSYNIGDVVRGTQLAATGQWYCYASILGGSGNALPSAGTSNSNWQYVGLTSASLIARGASPADTSPGNIYGAPLVEIDNVYGAGGTGHPGADTGSLWIVDHGSQTKPIISLYTDQITSGDILYLESDQAFATFTGNYINVQGHNSSEAITTKFAIDHTGKMSLGAGSLVAAATSGSSSNVLSLFIAGVQYYIPLYTAHA